MVPADPATTAGVSLTIGTTTYCVTLGGASGGKIQRNDDRTLSIASTAAVPANDDEGCLLPGSPSAAFVALEAAVL